MAGYKDELEARVVVSNWMSTRFTLEFLGIWEEMYDPDFNRMEFHTIKNADGRLVLTPKRWVERTNAIGIFSKPGRYGGGIFAHKDIAFEFGSWLSAAFNLSDKGISTAERRRSTHKIPRIEPAADTIENQLPYSHRRYQGRDNSRNGQ